CAQRPAVAEHDGLARAPVLVIDPRAVVRGDRAHCPSFTGCRRPDQAARVPRRSCGRSPRWPRLEMASNGFREFVLRGNVVDLAVAVTIGTAFTAVVMAVT